MSDLPQQPSPPQLGPSARRLNSEVTVARGPKFAVAEAVFEDPDGWRREHLIVRHPGAVVLLPVTDSGGVVFIENDRPALGGVLLELPAGTLEPGEAPEAAASRECEEETRLRPQRVEALGCFFTGPGMTDERMHAFLCTGLGRGDLRPDAGELVRPAVVPAGDVRGLIVSGRLRDAKSLAVLSLAGALGRLRV